MPGFHHTFADIFKTWIPSFCPEKIAATLRLVQQHQHWFTPARPPPHVIYSSVFMLSGGATLVDSRHQAAIGINDAVSRAEPILDSDQMSTVSHLWLPLLPYQARGASAPEMTLFLWNVYFMVFVGSPLPSSWRPPTHSTTPRLNMQIGHESPSS